MPFLCHWNDEPIDKILLIEFSKTQVFGDIRYSSLQFERQEFGNALKMTTSTIEYQVIKYKFPQYLLTSKLILSGLKPLTYTPFLQVGF